MNNLGVKQEGNFLVINTLIFWMFTIGIFTLTFDKLPFLNYSSYSPSAVFPFFISFLFIMLVGYKYESYDKWIWLFSVFSIIHSLISGMLHNNFMNSFQHIVTLVLGLSVFFSIRYAFSTKANNKVYEKLIILSILVPLLLGYLQLLNQFGINLDIINSLTGVFAEQVFENRIQMTSSEPSWSVIHLLTIGIILLYISRENKIAKILFWAIAILFTLSFSGIGYGVLILSFILYGLFTKYYRIKTIIILLISFIVIFMIVPFVLGVMNVTGYYVHRFDIGYLLSEEFLMTDESGFVRIVFPLIGLIEFVSNPFGLGGGFFYTEFYNTLINKFSYGLHFSEVQGYIREPETVSVRNLFVKILVEEGILKFSIFIIFLVGIYKRAKSQFSKYAYCLAIAFLLNFDSYAFVNFWLLLGVVASGYFDKRNTKI